MSAIASCRQWAAGLSPRRRAFLVVVTFVLIRHLYVMLRLHRPYSIGVAIEETVYGAMTGLIFAGLLRVLTVGGQEAKADPAGPGNRPR